MALYGWGFWRWEAETSSLISMSIGDPLLLLVFHLVHFFRSFSQSHLCVQSCCCCLCHPRFYSKVHILFKNLFLSESTAIRCNLSHVLFLYSILFYLWFKGNGSRNRQQAQANIWQNLRVIQIEIKIQTTNTFETENLILNKQTDKKRRNVETCKTLYMSRKLTKRSRIIMTSPLYSGVA